ncbi:hypothetical protein ABZ783_16905 [Micromonospora sp. NPDC047738]|uniref:hypothetical protein n=1 Tax=Micromonospora sp. NPDC047738 TaxID=3155741 RepID=UPI00340E92CB
MPTDDIEIRAILDASAILSYSRGHVHVGELLVDIADEGAYLGLPTVALLEAYAQTSDRPAAARLGVLATLPGVAVLPLSAPDAAQASHHGAPDQGRPGPCPRRVGGTAARRIPPDLRAAPGSGGDRSRTDPSHPRGRRLTVAGTGM